MKTPLNATARANAPVGSAVDFILKTGFLCLVYGVIAIQI